METLGTMNKYKNKDDRIFSVPEEPGSPGLPRTMGPMEPDIIFPVIKLFCFRLGSNSIAGFAFTYVTNDQR